MIDDIKKIKYLLLNLCFFKKKIISDIKKKYNNC